MKIFVWGGGGGFVEVYENFRLRRLQASNSDVADELAVFECDTGSIGK